MSKKGEVVIVHKTEEQREGFEQIYQLCSAVGSLTKEKGQKG